ncbi:hypothetical protein SUGI_0935020 [Cryptomeria japonica]|nr:hypothetical protein SUGI_0935020 [Cryptomeria japonica]
MEQVWKFKQSSNHTQGVKSIARKKVKWNPPPSGWKNLNFDGASKGNPGLSGYIVVIRDKKGNLIGAVCGQVGFVSNNIAEITALEEGLKWAFANGLPKVVIEGDSKVVLNGITNKRFMNWQLDTWIPRIYGYLQKFKDYHVQHTFCEGNQVANLLANHEIDNSLLAILSPAITVNRDLHQRLLEDIDHIPKSSIG